MATFSCAGVYPSLLEEVYKKVKFTTGEVHKKGKITTGGGSQETLTGRIGYSLQGGIVSVRVSRP